MFADIAGAAGSSSGLFADARYMPAGGDEGDAVTLRVMPITPDAVMDFTGARTLQTGHTFHLLTADVATRPEKGATITTLDDAGEPLLVYTLAEPARSEDGLRLKWICVTGEGEAPTP